MSSNLDRVSVAHVGALRVGPPATGVDVTTDLSLRAHVGWFVSPSGPVDEQTFCIVIEDDEEFSARLEDEQTFCVRLEDDERTKIK